MCHHSHSSEKCELMLRNKHPASVHYNNTPASASVSCVIVSWGTKVADLLDSSASLQAHITKLPRDASYSRTFPLRGACSSTPKRNYTESGWKENQASSNYRPM